VCSSLLQSRPTLLLLLLLLLLMMMRMLVWGKISVQRDEAALVQKRRGNWPASDTFAAVTGHDIYCLF
jgi:hypothetical protein